MATINVKDAAGSTVAIEKPLTPGRAAAASSRPIALSTEDKAVLDTLAPGAIANAAAPTKTEAATNQAVSVDLHGAIRVLNMASDGTVLDPTAAASVVGPAVHGAAISGAPVREGRRAATANPTAVADGQTVDSISTLVGVSVSKPYSIPEADWSYAAATGGISNTTTAVAVKAAGAAGLRNYITGMQVSSDALGAASELVIRDGASGTVLWRLKIGTAGILSYNISFQSPLKGTAATLLEVATLTASVTGGVFVNVQGYTAP